MEKTYRIGWLLLLLVVLPLAGKAEDLGAQLRKVIEGKAATVGVAVIFNGSELVTVNDMYRYPMMSTYKFHQALSVVDYINREKETLATEILVKQSDMKTEMYSPMHDANRKGNFYITIGDLLKYSLIDSDNHACDILFDYIGGPKTTDKYVRSLGITDFSITQTERDMHESTDNVWLNWTKPSAAALLLETFLQNPMFDKNQKFFLERAYTQLLRLSDLIRDMALITKTEEASELFEKETINIRDTIIEVTNDLENPLKNAHIKVENCVQATVEIEGNHTLLYSIFRNLMDNTINYAGENVTIHIENYTEDNEFYYFSYYDTGKGIEEEHLTKIFDRFYRINP